MGTDFAEMSSQTALDKTYRNEDNILDQTFKGKYVLFIMMILILHNIIQIYVDVHTNTTVALKPNSMSSLFLCVVFL